jgi:bacterioferritin-associated ferredoxin
MNCEETVRDVMAQSGVCASRCGVEHHAQAVPLTFYERKAA